jgi:hypothetical protein
MNKKIFLSVAAVGLLAASLTACGDSSNNAKSSKVEDCAAGLTKECLEGEWSFIGISNLLDTAGAIRPDYNFSNAPGRLILKSTTPADSFEFHLPAASMNAGQIDCTPLYGTWNVAQNTLTMELGKMTMGCLQYGERSMTFNPTLKIKGNTVELSLQKLWFMKTEFDDEETKMGSAEVFSITDL